MNVNVDFSCGPGPEFECSLGEQINSTCVLSEGLYCDHQETIIKRNELTQVSSKICRNASVRRIRELFDQDEL